MKTRPKASIPDSQFTGSVPTDTMQPGAWSGPIKLSLIRSANLVPLPVACLSGSSDDDDDDDEESDVC